jgi:3-deoxy-7-phosphoheptulonate synthase
MKLEIPSNEQVIKNVISARKQIKKIIDGKDSRLIIIVGPCSIHDPNIAIDYAKKLKELIPKVNKKLFIVMRVYFEKPRTTVGWKGLINDPDLNGTFDINKGIRLSRSLLLEFSKMGLPCGTEFLDLISPQYIAYLISWGAIGARTAESQTHRELASGMSCPIGIKNGTNGALKPAIDGIQAANHSHVFFSTTKEGNVSVFRTSGNSDSHIILRGGKEPNFSKNDIEKTLTALIEAGVNESIMVDASHGNSQKQFKKQIEVINNLAEQISEGNGSLRGLMLESNLVEGNQSISDNLTYGQSITDACMNWSDTLECLQVVSEAVKKRRG